MMASCEPDKHNWKDAPMFPELYELCAKCRAKRFKQEYTPTELPKISDVTGIKIKADSVSLFDRATLDGARRGWKSPKKQYQPKRYRDEVA